MSLSILIASKQGDCLSLGWRLTKEGHKVSMFIKDKESQSVGEGFINKISDYEQTAQDSDLIIIDDSNLSLPGPEMASKTFKASCVGIPIKNGSEEPKTDASPVKSIFNSHEATVIGFFNGKEFIEPIGLIINHNNFMPGNIGPLTKGMGACLVWMNKNKIYKESLGKMTGFLKDKVYAGYLSINCQITENELGEIGINSGFGYPAIYLLMETMKGNIGEWIKDLISGKNKGFKVNNPYAVCMVVATPPYPFKSQEIYKTHSENNQIVFNVKDRTGIWPVEVKRDKENKWFISGNSGFSVVVSGQGKSIEEAREMTYKRTEGIDIPNMMLRNDIGDSTMEEFKKLNSWGWFS